MAERKLSKLELEIMETLWTRGESSIREVQQGFPEKGRPTYGTIQTTIYRMEEKKIVRRVGKWGTSISLSRWSRGMPRNCGCWMSCWQCLADARKWS